MITKKEKDTAAILKKILQKDTNLLVDTAGFLNEIKKAGIKGGDYRAIESACNANITEVLLSVDADSVEDVEQGKQKIREALAANNLQEGRIDFLVDTFQYALSWTSREELERKEQAVRELEQQKLLKAQQEAAEAADVLGMEEQGAQTGTANEQPPAPSKPLEWKCQSCGHEHNTGTFCSQCGYNPNAPVQPVAPAKPVPEVQVLPKTENSYTPPAMHNPSNNNISLNTSSRRKGNGSKFFVVVLILAVIGGALYFLNDSDNGDFVTVSEQKKSSLAGNSSQEKRQRNNPCFLGEIQIGDSKEYVLKKLGTENKRENRGAGMNEAYIYDDMNVIFDKDGLVSALESNTGKYDTTAGVHQGDSLSDVINAYGESEYKSQAGNLTLYEYKVTASNGKNCLIRCAVNSSNRVDYISIRYFKEEQDAQVKSNRSEREIAEEAAQALFDFHRYITDRNYSAAYNCTSTNWQGQVSYDGWARGFRTTVKSEVDNVHYESANENQVVLNYRLTAVDNPGGTKQFSGKVVIIRQANGWKIDQMENH